MGLRRQLTRHLPAPRPSRLTFPLSSLAALPVLAARQTTELVTGLNWAQTTPWQWRPSNRGIPHRARPRRPSGRRTRPRPEAVVRPAPALRPVRYPPGIHHVSRGPQRTALRPVLTFTARERRPADLSPRRSAEQSRCGRVFRRHRCTNLVQLRSLPSPQRRWQHRLPCPPIVLRCLHLRRLFPLSNARRETQTRPVLPAPQSTRRCPAPRWRLTRNGQLGLPSRCQHVLRPKSPQMGALARPRSGLLQRPRPVPLSLRPRPARRSTLTPLRTRPTRTCTPARKLVRAEPTPRMNPAHKLGRPHRTSPVSVPSPALVSDRTRRWKPPHQIQLAS